LNVANDLYNYSFQIIIVSKHFELETYQTEVALTRVTKVIAIAQNIVTH